MNLSFASGMLILSLAGTLCAADNIWNPGNGDWSTPSNWSKGEAPGSSDTVLINNGAEVTFDIGEGNTSDILNMTIGSAGGSGLIIESGTLNSSNSPSYGRGVYVGEDEGSSGRLEVGGTGILNITGANGGGVFALSVGTAGDGELDISGTGRVNVTGYVTLGGRQPINEYPVATTGTAIVNISGQGVLSSDNNMYIGASGRADVNVSGQGRIEADDFFLGSDSYSAASHGEVTLSDSAVMYASWSINLGWGGYGKLTLNGDSQAIGRRNITVGLNGTGILELNDRSYVESINNLFIGHYAGSEGKLVMNDQSRMYLGEDGGAGYGHLVVGYEGKGEFTVNGGSFSMKQGIYVGYNAGSEGVVNLNGGTVETRGILGYNGEGSVHFNGGYLKAADSSYTDFISDTDVTIHAGGATIDTSGQNLNITASLLGTGLLLKVGQGDLSLAAANLSSGGISVEAGGIIAAHANGLGTGTVLVYAGATLDSSVALAYAGGMVIDGGSLGNNGGDVGTFSLADEFVMHSGTYHLTILSVLDFDVILGSGTNTFALNGGTIDLFGSHIDYEETYQIFDNFADGHVGTGLSVTGYDTANWQAVVDDSGLLYFLQVSNIPEPSSTGLLLGGLILSGCIRRRRLQLS